jgi:hypothetical protein
MATPPLIPGSEVCVPSTEAGNKCWRYYESVVTVFLPVEQKRRGGGPRPMSPEERLARFLSRIQQVEGQCWPWTAGCTPDGYGLVNLGRRPDGRQVNDYAHRISYTFANGPIPKGLNVLHSCDNPRCCNPAHLELGTQADNMHDAQRKGRLFTGKRLRPKRKRAFLTDSERVEIRRLRAAGVPCKEVAAQFNLSVSHVIGIGTGKRLTVLEWARAYDAQQKRSA